MRIKAILVGSLLLVPTLALAGTSAKISLSAAENICAGRAVEFSESIRGPFAEHPDFMMVQDHYRSCVHAKSGAYPQQKLVQRGRLLFNLNKTLGL